MRVARVFHVEAAVLPHPYDVIVLRFQLVEEVEGPLAEFLVALVAAVSKEDGYHGVDEEQLERRGREPFLLFFARMTEGVVRLPIRGDRAAEQFARRLHVVAVEQLAQSGPPLIEQIGQLSNANMWKILRTEPQKLPKLEVDGLERKLVLQVEILLAEPLKVAVGQRFDPMALGNGERVEQSRLPQEDGFDLQKVVLMVGDGLQRDVTGPCLEGVAVDSEAVVAGQRDEVGRLPRAVATLQAVGDGLRLLFQPLRLQRVHPRVDAKARQRGDDAVTGRISVGGEQFVVVRLHVFGNVELQLRQRFSPLVADRSVDGSAHVENHVVVARIAVVAVQIPVA